MKSTTKRLVKARALLPVFRERGNTVRNKQNPTLPTKIHFKPHDKSPLIGSMLNNASHRSFILTEGGVF